MNEIKKVSEITENELANYLRISEVSEQEKTELKTYLNIAKNYISNYTGIPEKSENEEIETLDSYSDFVIVVYVLCQDMYDNRTMYVDNKNINKTVQTILDMHTRNNL
ncbi:MAG: phage gp6-like head-tail connector protein [Clostridia bacterium]|nr:phage gp6-like head-tail connector protein [Clostridia bacterium]